MAKESEKSVGEKMGKRLLRYSTSAGVGSALWWLLHSGKGTGNVRAFNMNIPVWAMGGILGVSTTIVADMAHSFILPHINENKRLQHFESALLAPAVGGGAFVGATKLANDVLPSELGYTEVFLNGAGGEILSAWIFENLVNPMIYPDDATSFDLN